jgi:release factor glutamine methyltransferase
MLESLLRASGLPWLEARMLAERALGLSPVQLAMQMRQAVQPAAIDAFTRLCSRRHAGEPIAYILGEREFHGRLFKVTPDVLIPRPETELLCEAVLERLSRPIALKGASLLDLGTGSGAIAITLACERPGLRVTAVDASTDALDVARSNAQRLCSMESLRYICSDWFAALRDERFDVIASNPPYVATGDPHLSSGDLRFEPVGALQAGLDGMDCLRAIALTAPQHLNPAGWLLLEHGFSQGAAVRDALSGCGLVDVFTLKDLAGLERVSGARLPG